MGCVALASSGSRGNGCVDWWCARQDSNLHCALSERAASYRLGYWRKAGAFGVNRTRGLSRTGRSLFQLSYEGVPAA